ncbi:MAG: hypothetical protein GEV03_06420 [Streptosporangiales bacterium]|nr:hypothetical protein [Streptosporangiales bacterium]
MKAERDRRSAYDARGQALVTTSAALVTLLAALATLVKTGATPTFPPPVFIAVAVALALFVGAATCGILAGWNRHYAVTTVTTLNRMLAEHWTDDEVDARNNVATLHVSTLDTLRKANNFKANCVTLGLIIQVLALFSLAATVIMVIANV